MSMKKLLALLLAVVMVLSVAACGKQPVTTDPTQGTNPTEGTNPTQGSEGPTGPQVVVFEGDYTYNDYVSTLSANWNIHTYETSDESYPIEFLTSGLYSFIFNDELNALDGKDPYEGYVIVPEMAAELPIDVTETVKVTHPQFGIPADATAGYAYVIKLNPDACWDDGTPIKAVDWVESMKRLLDPKLQNYRAGGYYEGGFSIAGAEQYAKAGQYAYGYMISENYGAEEYVTEFGKNADGNYFVEGKGDVWIKLSDGGNWGSNGLQAYWNAYGEATFVGMADRWNAMVAATNAAGYVAVNETVAATLADMVAVLHGYANAEAYAADAGEYAYQEWQEFCYYGMSYPEFSYENVGLYQTGEYEFTMVLNKALAGFQLLYNLSGTWLVKTDLYDACLKQEGDAWFSTYCTSVETTPSYGPYVMSNYQMDKGMHFVKNQNWWGYSDGKHVYVDPEDGLTYPMYMTTEIDTVVVTESATVKMMFLKGQLMTYTLQTEDYGAYRSSDFCHFTPGQAVYFLILNGNMSMIKEREAAADFDATKYDLETLTLQSFHRALNLSYDRSEYSAEFNPAQSPAFGLIGTAYIYDPDTGARYRDSDQAKQVLCDVYGVDASKYSSLDEAVATITGYDPVAANGWFAKAYEEALAAGFVTDTDGDGKSDQQIEMIYSASADPSEKMQKIMKWLGDCANEAAKGTGFEGKISVVASAPLGNDWSTYIKAGQTDCVLGGWTGSSMDPYGLMEVYTNPSYQYDAKWFDSTSITLTLNLRGEDITMNLMQWQQCMTGTAIEVNGKTYNFGDGLGTYEERLTIMAAIEKEILLAYDYLPMTQAGSMFLLTQKAFYVVEEYNPVMGRGGVAYMRYNYNDQDWAAYIATQPDGILTY